MADDSPVTYIVWAQIERIATVQGNKVYDNVGLPSSLFECNNKEDAEEFMLLLETFDNEAAQAAADEEAESAGAKTDNTRTALVAGT